MGKEPFLLPVHPSAQRQDSQRENDCGQPRPLAHCQARIARVPNPQIHGSLDPTVKLPSIRSPAESVRYRSGTVRVLMSSGGLHCRLTTSV